MKLRYRILQTRWPDGGEWQTWGFYESDDIHRGEAPVLFHHNMDEPRWVVHHISHRIVSRRLPLGRVEEAIAKYADYLLVLPTIHAYEGDAELFSAALNTIKAHVMGLDYIAPRDTSEETCAFSPIAPTGPLAQAVALGFPLSAVSITPLPDSEVHVQVDGAVGIPTHPANWVSPVTGTETSAEVKEE